MIPGGGWYVILETSKRDGKFWAERVVFWDSEGSPMLACLDEGYLDGTAGQEVGLAYWPWCTLASISPVEKVKDGMGRDGGCWDPGVCDLDVAEEISALHGTLEGWKL